MTPARMYILVPFTLLASADCALAYVDPGVTGMLFQMGYVAFYGALAVLAAFFRPIKIFCMTVKQKLFGGKNTIAKKATEDAEADVEDIEVDPDVEVETDALIEAETKAESE